LHFEYNYHNQSKVIKMQNNTATRSSSPQLTLGKGQVAGAGVMAGGMALTHGLSVMAMVVQQTNQQNRKINTAKAYDPKKAEWNAFCNCYMSHQDLSTRYTVTSDKCFAFLTYHAFREQRQRGGKKFVGGSRPPTEFDPSEFNAIIKTYGELNLLNPNVSIPDPKKPLGHDALNTYKSVVRYIHDGQKASNANNLAWDLIYDGKCKALVGMVKARKIRVRRANFEEKLDHEFSPFTTLDQVGNIEEWFWNSGKQSRRSAVTGLRNRFAFAACYKGLLRHESLFLGELSDLLYLHVPRSSDEDPMSIGIMQIEQGKTVTSGGNRQYGRFLRAKCVKDCALGAMGFYLFQRFDSSGEMEDGKRPDFTKNKEWFSIKLMTDGTSDNQRRMQQDSYVKPIRKCFVDLRLYASHFGHWGRVSGPAELELKELGSEWIRILGNWDAKMQESRYSSKIPVKALRVMAGFNEKEKHQNPR